MLRRLLIPALFASTLLGARLSAAPSPALASKAAPAAGFPLLQDEARINEISKIIADQGDNAPRGLYAELGKMASFPAFKALQGALDDVKNEMTKQVIYSAMGQLRKNQELASKVLARVKKDALSKKTEESRPAAAAMANFGPAVHDDLFEIAGASGDRTTRAYALKGVLAKISGDPSEENLELLLDGLVVPQTTTRQGAMDILRRFRTEDTFKRFTKFVGDNKSSMTFKRLIVSAVGGHKLGESSTVDAGADMVLSKAAGQKDPILQYYALTSMARRGGTANVKLVDKLSKAKDATVRRAALLVGARSGSKKSDPMKLARDKDPIARQAAAITLGESGSDGSLDALHGLVTDEDPIVRAEAIRQLAERRDLRSVRVLIARLDEETGRLRADIRDSLESLTGRDYGMNAKIWLKFWESEKESFKPPTPEERAKAQAERAEKQKADDGGSAVAFYGIDIVSTRFALIIDTSGSMSAKAYTGPTRIEVAKKQLAKTLDRLRDGVLFNVIPFDTTARSMEGELIELDKDTREDSKKYAEALRASGGTNIYDALELAFEDVRVDTIYLMSDGAPSVGEITDPSELRDEVARWNSVRGITIHCIAVGQDHPLLRGLAEDSSGKYVRVD